MSSDDKTLDLDAIEFAQREKARPATCERCGRPKWPADEKMTDICLVGVVRDSWVELCCLRLAYPRSEARRQRLVEAVVEARAAFGEWADTLPSMRLETPSAARFGAAQKRLDALLADGDA